MSTTSPHEVVGINRPIPSTELHGPAFEQIPADLKALPQWVCWRLEERAGDITKVPYNAESGRRARGNDPTTWATFDTAVDAYLRGGYAGIGFMFWEGDGLTGLDLDHVIDPETGEIDPRALEILDHFQGTYCEISPSGTGFRIFTRGSPGRSGKNEGRGKWLEVYTHPSHRYLTVTGHHWPQAAAEVTAQQDALDWLHEKYFTKPAAPKPATKPATAPNLGIDDSDLLDKARAAANGHQFGQLWNGDTTAHRGDHSSADLALCSLLAFWTGKDTGCMDRLFRQSSLMRPKWDSRRGDTTYGQITIDKAIAECLEIYTERGNGHDQAAPADYSGYPEAQGDARQGRQEAKEAPADEQSINYRQVSEIQALPLDWLWYPYFLRRANNLLAGDSDTGKSKTLASMVSIATNGGRFPGTAVEIPPGNVIILAAEEDAATMLKPALLAAGADCSRVYLVESCAEYDAKGRMRKRLVTLEKDIESLITLGRKIGNLSLTMVDPITSYLGTRISGNDNTAIRSVLSGLQDFAEDTGHANILVTHPGKDNSRSAKLQILGATAFVAGVRSAIGVFRDPEDEAGSRRVMVPIKCNLVPESDRFGIAFEIHGVDVQDGQIFIPNVGAVNWIPGRVNMTADEMLAQQRAKQEEVASKEKGVPNQQQRVIDVLRAAGRPLSPREITEILEGEEVPREADPRRIRVRALLKRMRDSKRIIQDKSELYTVAGTAIEGEYVPF